MIDDRLIITLIILIISVIIALIKALIDDIKGKGFKFDTVTDLRLKRKNFNDKTYKAPSKRKKGGI